MIFDRLTAAFNRWSGPADPSAVVSTFRSVLDAMDQAALVVDARGTVVAATGAAAPMLDRPADTLEGADVASLLGESAARWVSVEATSGAVTRVPLGSVTAPRKWLAVHVTACPACAADYLALRLEDVTGLVALERRASQHEKTDTLGQLAGGIAHDFNNLLATIQLNAELLESDAAGIVPELAEIQRSVTRGRDLCRRLLGFARLDAAALRPDDLAAIVRDAVPMVRQALGPGVELVLDLQPAGIRADRAQLDMILLNLAVNAAQAMEGKGRLLIACRTGYGAPPEADPTLPSGPWVALEVRDSGPGIPADVLPRIFEPFFTSKPRGVGTGLGLSTVAEIVRAHGGHVRVSSPPGEGATFRVELPEHHLATPVAAPDGVPSSTRRNASGTVLLVDDDYVLRFALAKSLQKVGYTVLQASDGADALWQLDERHWDVTAVVTDLVMPRLDGGALVDAIRARRPDVPVVAMTGRELSAGASPSALAGVTILQKPFAFSELAELLGEALRPV